MMKPLTQPQNSEHDVSFLFTMAGGSVEAFHGKAAKWANIMLAPFTATTTIAWMVCDWFPTLSYGYGASSWLTAQLLKFIVVDSGLSTSKFAMWLATQGISISEGSMAIQYIASFALALIWLMVSLIPTIGKHVLKLYAMNGMPYADYYRQALNLFDAVTDWPLAASVAWGGVATVLGLYLNDFFLWITLPIIAAMLCWFFSTKLESLALSCFMTHFHLYKNSKITRG